MTTASSLQTADPPTTARLTETLKATEDYDIRMMLKNCRRDDGPTVAALRDEASTAARRRTALYKSDHLTQTLKV